MYEFNQELVAAGVMIDGNGLQPSSEGYKILTSDGETRIVDGPFAETKELISGYWVLQANSMEEAVAWAKRAPMDADGRDAALEIRQIFELDDFPENPDESGWREAEEKLREEWNAGSPGDAQGSLQPAPASLVYMGMVHATADSEAGVMPDEAELATMGALMEESAAAGILLGGEDFAHHPKVSRSSSTTASGRSSTACSPRPRSWSVDTPYAVRLRGTGSRVDVAIREDQRSGMCSGAQGVPSAGLPADLREEAADVFEGEERMRQQVADRTK